ncbi:MAG: N-acetyltransferase [Planctomycetota bacterium]
MIGTRPEQPGDVDAVRGLHEAAFGGPTEGAIADALRAACPEAVSLVAVDDGRVVGHVFFSPVVVSEGAGAVRGMGLAPMAVLPERQREGIGSLLVRVGVELLGERGCPFIVVLGHPAYYPRFGFVPASRHGLSCQWEGVPDEAFMVLILDEAAMAGVSGVARYRGEFDGAG